MKSIPKHLVLASTKDPLRSRMLCEHCGASDPLPQPIAFHQFDLLTKDFIKRHRACPLVARMTPDSIGYPVFNPPP